MCRKVKLIKGLIADILTVSRARLDLFMGRSLPPLFETNFFPACGGYLRYFYGVWPMFCGRTFWGVGLNRSNTEIVGLNPTQGADVFPLLSVLCCPV
jgi:hypothetical protein